MERDCCKFICGAPTTIQGYEIEKNRKHVMGWQEKFPPLHSIDKADYILVYSNHGILNAFKIV